MEWNSSVKIDEKFQFGLSSRQFSSMANTEASSGEFGGFESPEPDRISPVESLAESNFTSVSSTSSSRRVVQQDAQQSRIRQRLDACRLGLQKLDLLRDKHQRIMQDMRSQLGIAPELSSLPEISVIDFPPQTRNLMSPDEMNGVICRIPSPSPSSAEWSSSNMSHRSSLSVDSGCLSMTSDSVSCQSNGFPNSKLLPDHKNPVTSPDGTILGKMRQKFFAAKLTEKLLDKNARRKLSASTTTSESRSSFYEDEGISADLMASVIESTAAPPPPVPAPRYRKRSLTNKNPPCHPEHQSNSRPKSLYTYPEENTVVVESIPQSSEAPSPVSQTPIRKSPKAVRSPRIVRSESVQMLRTRTDGPCRGASNGNCLIRSASVAGAKVPASSENCIFRASRVFINPQENSPPGTLSSTRSVSSTTPPSVRRRIQPGRPQSIACDPYKAYDSNLNNPQMFQKKNKTTWEDVKRMLDPLFEERSSPKLIRQNSETENKICKFVANGSASPASVFVSSGKHSPLLTPRHSLENGHVNHVILSRSISSQSSDSNKSCSTRRKEKQWHESEQL